MKPKMKKLICTAIVLSVITAGFAQKKYPKSTNQSSTYQSGIGIRMGTGYYDLISASYKTFLGSTPGALELNLGVRPQTYGHRVDVFNLSFSASYQYHFDIPPVPGLKWFIGGGLTTYNSFVKNNDYYDSGFGFGIFPTGGADYKFAQIPLDVSLDIRPTIGLVRPNDYYDYFNVSFGASARYTFR
jgi:hypothetical protein